MQYFTNETIDLNTLPKYEETTLANPDPKYWKVIVINLFIFLLLIAIGLGIFILFNESVRINWILWTSLYIIFAALLYLISRASFKKRGFALREKDVLYKSGIVAEKTTIIPLNRIQHVALNEGMFSRMFGLGTLQIYTASGSSGDMHIAGIEIEQAKAFKEALVQRLDINTKAENE
ncbi:PH domain-containing protein [Pedobacter nanyangensis]|uniref:PH domain-containing protein n=1 Tax=Pedobacter nanyangensis TaxID=1562389 RepID=UPI000DE25D1C|nr:PH domain-containing protein [Pedobacter nanyangensis]